MATSHRPALCPDGPFSRMGGRRGLTLVGVIVVVLVLFVIAWIVWYVWFRCDAVCKRITTVEIIPAVSYAAPNEQFQLYALARDAAGTPVAKARKVKWSGSVTFSSRKHNPTVVTVPNGSVHDIRVKMGKVTSGNAVVMITAPTAGPATVDTLKTVSAGGGPVAVALVDAMPAASPTCLNDMNYAVAGVAMLGRNMIRATGCTSTLAVFAPGHGVLFEKGAGIANSWTNGVDVVRRTTLPPSLAVPLAAWYRAGAAEVTYEVARPQGELLTLTGAQLGTAALEDVTYATDIYSRRRAGMRFKITAEDNDGTSRTFAGDPACSGLASQLNVELQQGIVNVVYVAAIESGVPGQTCISAGMPPVVIISMLRKHPSTLAHEFAHVMALWDPPFTDWRGGHTTYLRPDFDETNLMWGQENPIVGLERDHLSLGQVFRMSVDARSWLNVSGIRTGDVESCQGQRDTSDPCPKLALDVGKP